ncbi:unnamed protein product [Fasciola hepatica]|uniref:Uncharacterized protein n=1 Tax=Fasciola hepatica TaxID=6192 RepID=A0ABC9HFA7_FASHE
MGLLNLNMRRICFVTVGKLNERRNSELTSRQRRYLQIWQLFSQKNLFHMIQVHDFVRHGKTSIHLASEID